MSTPSPRVSVPGPGAATFSRFGDYELLEEVARGGMGVVYRARQVSLNRIVAVKMLLYGRLAGDEFLKRFRTEAEAAASLRHPNIVAIYEVGEHEGQPYFTMDHVSGQNLSQLAHGNPLLSHRAAVLLRTVAEAVHFAHQHGVIHRDLKPSNILVAPDGQPQVTDFGIAKRFDADSRSSGSPSQPGDPSNAGCPTSGGPAIENNAALDLTGTGQLLGTPSFMSPEQARGRRDLAPSTDVYSLGAVLYFLVSGRPPFVADSLQEILRQVTSTEPVSLRALNPAVPRDLETICLKCLNKEPTRRYRSAQAMAEDLARFLTGEPIRARPVGRLERLWRWGQREPRIAASLAATFALLIALVILSVTAARRVERERALAEADARRSQQVTEFIASMFWDARPDSVGGQDFALLHKMVEHADDRLKVATGMDPRVEAELRRSFGQLYLERGYPGLAEPQLRRALDLHRRASGATQPITRQTHFSLTIAVRNQGRVEEFARLIHEGLELQLRIEGTNNLDLLNFLNNAALVARDSREKLALLRRSLAVARQLGATNDLRHNITLENLGTALRTAGALVEAELPACEAVVLQRRLSQGDTFQTLNSERELCRLLWAGGNLREAESTLRRVARSYEQQFGMGHPTAAETALDLAQLVRDRGNDEEHRELLRRITDMTLGWTNQGYSGAVGRVMSGAAWQWTAEAWRRHQVAATPSAQEAIAEAERLLNRMIRLQQECLPPDNWLLADARSQQAGLSVLRAAVDPEAGLEARLAWLIEAEAILEDSVQALMSAQVMQPEYRTSRPRQTLERLVQLCQVRVRLAPGPDSSRQLADGQSRLARFNAATSGEQNPDWRERSLLPAAHPP